MLDLSTQIYGITPVLPCLRCVDSYEPGSRADLRTDYLSPFVTIIRDLRLVSSLVLLSVPTRYEYLRGEALSGFGGSRG